MSETFKVIIAGGRNLKSFDLLEYKCDLILKNIKEPIEIISGKQKSYDKDLGYYGADYFGKIYAEKRGYALTEFPADWDKHGKSAGIIRNQDMGDYGNALIAFWDGKSNGTRSMIEIAKKKNLSVKIIYY